MEFLAGLNQSQAFRLEFHDGLCPQGAVCELDQECRGEGGALHPRNSMWLLAEELQNDQRSRVGVMCSAETWQSSLGKGIQALQGAWGEDLRLFHGDWGLELVGSTRWNRKDGIPGV